MKEVLCAVAGVFGSLIFFNWLPWFLREKKIKKEKLEEQRGEYKRLHEEAEKLMDKIRQTVSEEPNGSGKTYILEIVSTIYVAIDIFDFRNCSNKKVFEAKGKVMRLHLHHLKMIAEKMDE